MIRKLMLGAMAAVGLGFGGQVATANEPVRGPITGSGNGFHPPRVDYDFVVFVQRHHGWERYGRYETLFEARRIERQLERDGFRVRVEEVRDRRPW
ncbi:MAG: hypothetical protein J0I06_04540 [Planctomycetes bacterium]|nr:hypothetical protein [Planctomycetota bacterium]